MLYETVQGWYREAEAKGIAIGEAKGEAKGEARGIAIGEVRGEAKLLVKLLENKFGPLETHIRESVYRLDRETLEKCADRLLQASSLQEVLGDSALH